MKQSRNSSAFFSKGTEKTTLIDKKRKVKLVCNKELKDEMISENEINPFNMFYIVDVEVKRISGKPVAYHIKKIHDNRAMVGLILSGVWLSLFSVCQKMIKSRIISTAVDNDFQYLIPI